MQEQPADPLSAIARQLMAVSTASTPSPKVLLEPHVKACGQDNQAYPTRQPVADTLVPWAAPFPGYEPASWTHPDVFANDRELDTGYKWADPPDVTRSALERRVSYAGDGEPKALRRDEAGVDAQQLEQRVGRQAVVVPAHVRRDAHERVEPPRVLRPGDEAGDVGLDGAAHLRRFQATVSGDGFRRRFEAAVSGGGFRRRFQTRPSSAL